ncbi:MAG: hypothetical protein ACJAZM_000402 [Cyclobacteriaceae bacterium]
MKFNIAVLGIWVLFMVLVTGGIGEVYGIHYLFLDPEYLNDVSFFSFFWVGLALGYFMMAFHISSYILLGHRYAFIGILERPFTKFAVNNQLIPTLSIVIYVVMLIRFHWSNETIEKWNILVYLGGLLAGIVTMGIPMAKYLQSTNSDIFAYLVGTVDKRLRKNQLSRERMMERYRESREPSDLVRTYLDDRYRIRNCEKLHDFPDRASVLKVFDQNHINSVMLGFGVLILILLLGFLVEYPIAQIPAGASVLFLLSMLILLIGAISYWFRGWGLAITLGAFLLLNVFSKFGFFSSPHPAVGLDYERSPAPYSDERLLAISDDHYLDNDLDFLSTRLDAWKHTDSIPKRSLILLSVSGGGQRAALWTLATMQELDRSLEGQLMNRVFSITGASGGMIGAAYYRELFLQQKLGKEVRLDDHQWTTNIAKDNLNALVFSLISNEFLLDLKSVTEAGQSYVLDRGMLFEKNLNRNLDYIFQEPIGYYRSYEQQAVIPMLIFSPVVGNDGRKLYVSASPVSFLTKNRYADTLSSANASIRGVDFSRLLKQHQADSLTMLSAMRMSASFPYITPTIQLPTDPPVDVMDAGISDNFGISDALQITFASKDWINKNIDQVILISIRDTRKMSVATKKSNPSLLHRFTYPISSVYNNLSNMQDVKNDLSLAYADDWLDVPLEIVSFEYDTRQIDIISLDQEVRRASLSWHLTAQEKQDILESLYTEKNIRAKDRLLELLAEENQ